MKRMLAICLAITLLFTAMPIAASLALSQYGTVTGGWLRLRSAPSFDASTVSSYFTGTQVKILGSSGSWYQVQAPDNKTGYMYASYITFSGGGTGNAYVTSSNGYGVRMRSGPGTGYKIIAVYSVGTAATVLQTGSTWSKIQIGSRVGYMMNKFLTTDGGGGGGGTGDAATVWSANGYGVRLRSGPGTNYAIIGVYSVGTAVSVLSHGTTWDYISVGSRKGYMMREFLRYYSSNVVTAVTLNNTTPVVGSELSAASITPSGATVTYNWYVGTSMVSTSPTYTVVAGDADQQIKLTVTGSGSYTGSATSALTSPVVSGTAITGVSLNNPSPVVGDVLAAASVAPSGATVSYAWYVGGNLVGSGTTYTVAATDVYQTIRLRVTGTGLFTGTADATAVATVQPTGTITGMGIENQTNNTTDGNEYPNVNDVLAAKPIPATATATYRWTYSDDTTTVLGTNSQITVTAAMVGRKLAVAYTGSGNYSGTGSVTSGTIVSKTNISSVALNNSTPKYDPLPSDAAFNNLVATVSAGTTNVTTSCTFEWYRGASIVSGVTGSTYTLTDADRGSLITVKAIAKSSSSYAGSLSKTATATVKQRLTGVAISGTATVGNALTPSLDGGGTTPNNVIATYSWTLNSTASSTLSYTVPAGDVVGKTLTLTVVGKGDYYTDAPLTATATVAAATITAVNFPATAPVAGSTYAVTLTPATAPATYAWTGNGVTYTGATITVDWHDIGHKIALKVTPGSGYAGDASVLEQSTPLAVIAKTFSTARFFGTFSEGKTITIDTDLPNDSISQIDWYLDSTLAHSGLEKTFVLPSGSAGTSLSAVVTGKLNYTGSSRTITGVPINNDPDTATVLSLTAMFTESSDGSMVETPVDTTVTPTSATDTASSDTTGGTTDSSTGDTTGGTTDSSTGDTTGEQLTATELSAGTEEQTVTEGTDAPDASLYTVAFKLSPTTLAADTVITAQPAITDGIQSYAWFLNDVQQDSYLGSTYYTVTQDDLDATRVLKLIVTYDNGLTATCTLKLAVKVEDTTATEETPAE